MKVQIISFVAAQIQHQGRLFLELQAKMLSANGIAGFLNQLYLKKKLMNQLDF